MKKLALANAGAVEFDTWANSGCENARARITSFITSYRKQKTFYTSLRTARRTMRKLRASWISISLTVMLGAVLVVTL